MPRPPFICSPEPSSYDELFVIKSIQASFNKAVNLINKATFSSKKEVVNATSDKRQYKPITVDGQDLEQNLLISTEVLNQSERSSASLNPRGGVHNLNEKSNESQLCVHTGDYFGSPLEDDKTLNLLLDQSSCSMQI